jgi:hypothetical protein
MVGEQVWNLLIDDVRGVPGHPEDTAATVAI